MTVLLHGILVFAGLLVYVLLTRIAHQRRAPSAAVAWVLLIATLPYLGLPLLLLFGTRKFARPGPPPGALARRRPAASDDREPTDRRAPAWADELLGALALPPKVAGAEIVFHADGAASRAALIELIRRAADRIDLSTFILAHDTIGDAVVAELVTAARRGVRIRLLLDAFGSLRVPRRYRRQLSAAGIAVQWFMPFLHNPLRGRTNLRNHRKLMIVDGERLWSGGRNLAVEYFDDRPGHPAWIDLTFTAVGPLARQAAQLFERDWYVARGRSPQATEDEPGERQAAIADNAAAPVRLVPSGPDHPDDTVYALLLTAAFHARRRILAVSPYCVPDDALLSAFCMASRRGVEVTVLLPARSNHPLADLARHRALRHLVQSGARVMMHPVMIHAKAFVVDDALAMCGSVNLDGRSLFLNYELMAAFYGTDEIDWLARWMRSRIDESAPYEAKRPSWWRDLLEGMVRAVGFQL